jgi:nucleotide-binding universal stress UspA family protein
MASSKIYLVPVDFSKSSDAALTFAIKLAKESKGKLFLLHVISDSSLAISATEGTTPEMVLELRRAIEEGAEAGMKKLIARKRLRPGQFRSLIVRGGDPADIIAVQGKKLRAFMIVMGSHGRTGLKRLLLGSVAERTLRYAKCPVLIVKQ